jgi:hypothetical protein
MRSVPTRLEATTGTRLAPAWPRWTVRQCSMNRWRRRGAPIRWRGIEQDFSPLEDHCPGELRYHWSQQMPTPMVPCFVFQTFAPVSRG